MIRGDNLRGRAPWRREGQEPDPRFTFANERTFLAWIRTSLALVAGGVGVDAFADELAAWSRTALAATLIAFGAVVAASSYARWRRAEMALRRREALPVSAMAAVMGYGLGAASLALLVLVVLS